MNDLLTYIDEYQHTPFTLSPLNEVDILIINELTYLPYKPDDINQDINLSSPLSLQELYQRYWTGHEEVHKQNPFLATKERHQLLEALAHATRYQEVQVARYTNVIDEQTQVQFCAMTYILPSQDLLISYRGTDDTLVGWKEDFNLTYLDVIPAQDLAQNYLEDIISQGNQNIIISGHSKGGNLAYFACLALYPKIKDRLLGAYLFDSPGLNQDALDKPYFQDLSKKVYRYIPEDAVVGRILDTGLEPIIIKSSSFFVFQHVITNWKVEENHLVRLEATTESSDILEKTLKDWCALYSNQELENYFEYIYKSLLDLGIQSLNDLTSNFLSIINQILTSNTYGSEEENKKYSQYSWKLLELWRANRKDYAIQKSQSNQQNWSDKLNDLPQKLISANKQNVISLNRPSNKKS